MANRSVVRATIAFAAVVWSIGLIVEGVGVDLSMLRIYNVAAGSAVIGLTVFDRWLWRWWPFNRMTRGPNLSGTWRGELTSTWSGGNKTTNPTAIPAFLVIRQTFSEVSVELLTGESRSSSQLAEISTPKGGSASLSYTYLNMPRILVRDGSAIHHGSAVLSVSGASPYHLDGFYWTERDTKGELRFDTRVRSLHSSYEEAERSMSTSAHD